jgi:hypothetical protein
MIRKYSYATVQGVWARIHNVRPEVTRVRVVKPFEDYESGFGYVRPADYVMNSQSTRRVSMLRSNGMLISGTFYVPFWATEIVKKPYVNT